MKTFLKYALGAAVVAGAATFAAAPASAQVSINVGFGPGYGYSAPRGFVCDPYSRFYNAFNCIGRGYGYGPSFYNYGPRYGFNYNRGWTNRSWNNNTRGWNDNRGNGNGGGRNGHNR